MRNLLSNQIDTEDISHHISTVAHYSFPFPQIIDEEISDAILRTGSTTPGKDGISTALLRLAWPLISATVFDLFQSVSKSGITLNAFVLQS